MGHEDWTVDRLHVALPHSASRQQLLHDVNLTPIDALPAVLDGWAAAAEDLEKARPMIEAARVSMKSHGVLPEGLGARDVTADILREAGPRHERTAPTQHHGNDTDPQGHGQGAA
ncbi:hypothetical protein ACIGJO_27085 [Streptomyces sp. NPDC079020]|uniref:hypothetical protein n=1 Tax=Streptomyces sp. NPDC079020 TaxID=3365722 RepID=UPI0037D6E24F